MGDSAIVSAAAALLGAFVGGGAAIWAAHVAADKSERAAVAKEERDEQRQSNQAVATARREAAGGVIEDLAAMRDLWTTTKRGSPVDDAKRGGRLWDLHEKVRARALLLPSDLRDEVATLNGCLRFADEVGGDRFRRGGFIFLGTASVARLAYETAEERLSRFIAGDVEVAWSPDALRLKTAYEDLMTAREDEYADEVREYESERSDFDAAHPSLAAQIEAARRSRGLSDD